jgi:hypothetical protein
LAALFAFHELTFCLSAATTRHQSKETTPTHNNIITMTLRYMNLLTFLSATLLLGCCSAVEKLEESHDGGIALMDKEEQLFWGRELGTTLASLSMPDGNPGRPGNSVSLTFTLFD